MLLYDNSEHPCEKLLCSNKNASCYEHLRLDCLHFTEKMDLIFNRSINIPFYWLRIFWQKSSVLVRSALHTTFMAEIPPLESFLIQGTMGNEGCAVHSSPLMVWWNLERDRLSQHHCHGQWLDVQGSSEFTEPWCQNPIFCISEQPDTDGSYHSPFCRALRRGTQNQDPPWSFGSAELLWRTVQTPEDLTVPWFFTAKRFPMIFLAWKATSQPRQRPGALSQHCLVPGYKSLRLETLASL